VNYCHLTLCKLTIWHFQNQNSYVQMHTSENCVRTLLSASFLKLFDDTKKTGAYFHSYICTTTCPVVAFAWNKCKLYIFDISTLNKACFFDSFELKICPWFLCVNSGKYSTYWLWAHGNYVHAYLQNSDQAQAKSVVTTYTHIKRKTQSLKNFFWAAQFLFRKVR
jgi:hypothetical protein